MSKYFRPLALLALLAAVWFAGCKAQNVENANPSQVAPAGETQSQPGAPLPPAAANSSAETKQPQVPAPEPKATPTKERAAAPKAPSPPTTPIPAPAVEKTIVWRTDIEAAQREGKAKGKNLLLFFHTEWCGYCRLMLEDTFPRPEVITFVTRNFIPVKIDAEKESALAARYGITGYPTSIVITPQHQEKGRIPGYLPPKEYLAMLADFNRR